MRLPKAVFMVGGLALALASCAGGDPICINGGTDCTRGPIVERSFAVDVMPLWVGTCDTSPCHADAAQNGNLSLDIACTDVYNELLGEARLDTSDGSNGARILAGDSAATAFFVLKAQNVSTTVHGGQGALESGTAAYNVLADWINGARVNDCP